MVRTRLEIADTSVPFGEQIPVSINFNIADVREPDKFKSSWSKTISLPESNALNILFENVFEVNSVTNTFNKNKKTKVKYFVDDIVNLEGDLQLLKITINTDNLKIYECALKGEGASFFGDIGEKYITGNPDSADDLDFSEYNHIYERYTQMSSWTTYANLGYGFIYGHVENGNNGGNETVFSVADFLPMFHVREYVKKIIEKTGRTYTSSILESAEFKKHVVYPNLSSINLTPTQIQNKQYYVGLTSDYTMTASTSVDVDHTNESAPFFDTSSQSNGWYVQMASNGYYNTVANNVYDIKMTHTNPAVAYCTLNFESVINIKKSPDSGSSFFSLALNNSALFNTATQLTKNVNYTFNHQLATGELFLSSGDRLYHNTAYYRNGLSYYTSGGIEVLTGTGTVTVKLKSGTNGTSFYSLLTQKSIQDGDYLLTNSALPNKIKQKDFLKSIIQMFNLQIEVDKNNANNLIIETFDVFHAGGILNYENRTDLDKEQTNNINTLDSKRYIFRYKPDSDYYNTLFQTKYNEPFGTETINVENEFSVAEKVNEVIFSPTPNVANYKLGIVVPKIYKNESNVIKPTVPNIRILTCGGIKNAVNSYTYKGFGYSDLITKQYLYVGHTDNPTNPSFDLNFGLPKEVFYTFIGTFFTNNNLYNRFHKNYILNISDRDAKFITKYLWVNSLDINKFSFRNRLFIDGSYYIVNRIENYTPLNETSTKYELVKLLYTDAFTPTSIAFVDNPTTGSSTVTARVAQSTTIGNSTGTESTNTLAIGDYIISPPNSNNVLVVGDNTIVPDNVDGFVQLNGVYIPKVANGTAITEIGSGGYYCNEADGTILIKPTISSTDIYLPLNNLETVTYTINDVLTTIIYGKKLTLKRIDSTTNIVTIYPDGSDTIDGLSSYTLSTTNTLNLQYSNGNWIII